MIPICRAPKRFVCALGRARRPSYMLEGMAKNFRVQSLSIVANNSHQFGIASKFSTASPLELDFDDLEHQNIDLNLAQLNRKSSSADQSNQALIGGRNSGWWTGKAPTNCPGMKDGSLFSLPQLSLEAGMSRKTIQAYFDNTWTLTEVLLAGLEGEAAFVRPPYHELRHPMIFYYGHPAALYINKLRVAGLLKDAINPYFEVIFETGVDEMSWDDLSKNKMSWPSVAEVHSYRKKVYEAVTGVINNITDEECAKGIDMNSPLWALVMAFEHERIHLETSSVLISEMPVHLTRFPEGFPAYHESIKSSGREVVRSPVAGVHYPSQDMIPVGSQSVRLGKSADKPSFGWDNEYGSRTYDVPAFQAAKYKTSNGEFWEFVCDGGYSKPELWTDAGWKWRSFRNAKWPSYWVGEGPQGLNQFSLRLLFDVIPMAWDLPVCVNMHEAAAFAIWKSNKHGKNYRVISELEHHAIRDASQQLKGEGEGGAVDMVLKGPPHGQMMREGGINFNLSCSSMSPVTALPPNAKGFHDVFGNAWDWTTSYFSALPGFEVHPFYEDFSTPCFDGLHHVIMGGSFMSTGNEASIYSRFHFRPHFFQHASFRVVEQLSDTFISSDSDAPGPFVGNYPFRRSLGGMVTAADESGIEKERYASSMSKNFGTVSDAFSIPIELSHASSRVNQIVLGAAKNAGIDISKSNILDVGCGQGGLTFLLARQCRFVIGIDHNHDDIETARLLLTKQPSTYSVRGEGDRVVEKTVCIEGDFSSKGGNNEPMVEFRCADPMCLPAELSGFDVVVLNDVIDKVSAPGSVLSRLGGARGMVRQGGVLVILSAYQWKESVTPRSLWLGGNGQAPEAEETSPEAALNKRLSADFECIACEQVPLFWQQSSRDLKGKLYHVTQWKRL